MKLLRDIGPSGAGAYAFVSPVIAVVFGILVNGETIDCTDLIGMTVMLAAAYLALRPRAAPEAESLAATNRRELLRREET